MNYRNRLRSLSLSLLLAFLLFPCISHAGLDKWLREEAIPTLTGERPLEIKDYVSFRHKDIRILVAPLRDRAEIQLGPVSIKTAHLRTRLMEAGAIYSGDGSMVVKGAVLQSLLRDEYRSQVGDAGSASGDGGLFDFGFEPKK